MKGHIIPIFWTIIFISAVLILISIQKGDTTKSSEDEIEKVLSAESTKESYKSTTKKHFEKQFSLWDGSHKGLVKHIKSIMHDPSSFEHVKTLYIINDNGYDMRVIMDYRGKNAFGALRLSTVEARIDYGGNIWEIE